MNKLTVLFLLLFLSATTAFAQSHYRLDSTYGINGISTPLLTHEGIYDVYVHILAGVVVQNDDKMVAVAMNGVNNGAELLRFKTNGSFDSTFNSAGYVLNTTPGIGLTNYYSYGIEGIELDTLENSICTYSVDHTGSIYTSVQSYKPNGVLNTAFGSVGTDTVQNVTAQATSICRKTNKIFAGGYGNPLAGIPGYMIFSLNGDGSRNAAFGSSGIAHCTDARLLSRTSNVISAVKAMDDGRVYIAGQTTNSAAPDSFFVGRLKSNGSADSSFGLNGFVLHAAMGSISNFARPGDIHIDSLGQLYVVVSLGFTVYDTDRVAILKLDSVGNPVSSFGAGGYQILSETFAAFQPSQYTNRKTISYLQNDGKLIIAGTSDTSIVSKFKILRLNTDGSYDATFCTGGAMTISNGHRDKCAGLRVQSDGKIVMTGYYKVPMAPGVDSSMPMLVRLTNKQHADTTTGLAASKCNIVHFSVYPNPSADGAFSVSYSGLQEAKESHLMLYDIAGRLLASSTVTLHARNNIFSYRIPDGASPGVYYLKAYDGSSIIGTIELISY